MASSSISSSISPSRLSLALLFLLASSLLAFCLPLQQLDDVDCVYTLFIRTGSKDEATTNATISMLIFDGTGKYVNLSNLVEWGGAMGARHRYFQQENLDIFSGTAECLNEPPCKIMLISDGSGIEPNWYCIYVKVVMTRFNGGSHVQDFIVERWVEPPSNLTAVEDLCTRMTPPRLQEASEPRKPVPSIVG